MDSTSTIWSDFLTAATKDEMKKETNLVVLGNYYCNVVEVSRELQIQLCWNCGWNHGDSRASSIEETGHRHYKLFIRHSREFKSKDGEGRSCYIAFLIIDYSGVIHIFILTNDTYWDTLESLVTKEAFGDVDLMDPIYLQTFFLVAIDFRDTASIMDELTHVRVIYICN